MWRSRLFWRLFGPWAALLLCAIGLPGALLLERVEQYAVGQIEDSLRTKALLVREAVRGLPAEEAPLLQRRMVSLRQEISTRITLLAEDGRVLADSEEEPGVMENHATRPEVRAARD